MEAGAGPAKEMEEMRERKGCFACYIIIIIIIIILLFVFLILDEESSIRPFINIFLLIVVTYFLKI